MRLSPALLLSLLCACESTDPPPPPRDTGRCEVRLEDVGLFDHVVGSGVRARVLAEGEALPGGPRASGRAGDVLLESDRVRVVLRQPGPAVAGLPLGGAVVDADLRRPEAEAGRDQLDGLALLTAFGRTVAVEKVEVLQTGEGGGKAVVAASGPDAPLPALQLQSRLGELLGEGEHTLVVDPASPLPLRVTTYFVLLPGEPRVRLLTALCNTGSTPVQLALGDVVAPGPALARFNPHPSACAATLEQEPCAVETGGMVGFQGDGVAYGYRSYRLADPRVPEEANTLLALDGLSVTLAGGEGRAGLLAWTNPQVSERPGTLAIPGGDQRVFLRDLFVTRDLAELHAWRLAAEGLPRSRLDVTVKEADGAVVTGARVSAMAGGRLVTLAVTDGQGVGRLTLEPSTYLVVATVPGRTGEVSRDVPVSSGGEDAVTLVLPPE